MLDELKGERMHPATRAHLDLLESAALSVASANLPPEAQEELRDSFAKMREKEERASEKAVEAVERLKKNLPSKGARWTKPVGEFQEISLVKKRQVLGTIFQSGGGWKYELPDAKKTRGDDTSSVWCYDLDEAKARFRKMIDGWAIESASVPKYEDGET